jgi:DNA end-binding protein Ku
MAKTLVGQMTTDWDPAAYTDEYRSALMKVIDAKVATGGRELPKAARHGRKATNVIDLAQVLRQSLDEAKAKKAPKAQGRRARARAA